MKNRFLLCPPHYFDISYSINPWMDTERTASFVKQEQWEHLVETFKKLDVDLSFIQPVEGLPDMVFIDAGVIYKDVFISSNFKHKERQGEKEYFCKWFENEGYKVISLPDTVTFEGHGDSLWSGNDKLFFGYGFRSDETIGNIVKDTLDELFPENQIKTFAIGLTDPRFYHLDTCFCPLNEHQAIYHPAAIKDESIAVLSQDLQLFPVPEEEATKFACNAVVVGKDVILPAETPKTCALLEDLGFTTHPVHMTEFIKAGGACKCLSLKIS